ncbi:MAG: hypothetical protein PHX60_12700 [Giesbergeria sp.]|jgi:hypothetical protein|uniref:hypothetical protein n=1 Tax=Giesbergeria sp. TaxID=2818473 RepID=UPI002638B4A9|nr:hypothetical protein [Giesbergeria sp.]MDD2610521.1 hypothetical protein [Giesbergeria sp.]
MLSNNTPTTIELASNSVLTVAPSMVFPNRCIDMRFYDRAAWASFGIELSADQARQLAAALVAQADALEVAA